MTIKLVMSTLILWLSLWYPLTSLAACEKPIRVGMAANFPPLVFKRGEALYGIEVDLSRELKKYLGCSIQRVEMPWLELFPALESGEVDLVMSGVSITSDRRERLAFTEPYMSLGQMAIIRRENIAVKPRSLDELLRDVDTVGYETGTTGESYALRYRDVVSLKGYDGPKEGLMALQRKEISLFIHDAPTSWLLASEAEYQDLVSMYRMLTNEDIAWVVSKDRPLLLKKLNSALLDLRERGRLNDIINRWIPITVQADAREY
ncbi:polar amino acid transport system substrate-binding protein [Sinobacterium caligoides]|uniref:Polar amino acid transport system substrate-binding protein n=1 Tax=Sinobacterium caligoides TaxID=933926 RepID=A0A3N2D4Z1_9GAMM|nr:transporter substrate-binding domain-containing protein [Sinobacterium caligoides]ROR94876.1 polar amino acid transport system substrate-binding protein [Sinobacterium caligoides]